MSSTRQNSSQYFCCLSHCMSLSTQTGQLIYFVVPDPDRNPEFCLRNKQTPRCVYFVARKPFLTHEFYPRNTQNARCVCFVVSTDLMFCLHMQSAPSPEYAISGDYSSGAAVSSSVGLSSRPAVACCPRNTQAPAFLVLGGRDLILCFQKDDDRDC